MEKEEECNEKRKGKETLHTQEEYRKQTGQSERKRKKTRNHSPHYWREKEGRG